MTWLDDLTLDTVIVHTTHGESVKGLRRAVYDDGVVLRDAQILEAENQSVFVDGDVFIPRERVHYMQLLQGGGERA